MLSINGRLHLRRVRWHCPQEGSHTPADRWLDDVEATISEGVREMACRLNQHASSFQHAADNLQRAAHLTIGKETLRQLVESEGRHVQQAMQRAELMPDWSAADCTTDTGSTRMYLGCDGVKVPLVTDEEKHKRRAAIRQKRKRLGRKCRALPRAKAGADNAYKDFKIGYLYDESQRHRYVGVTSGNHERAGRMLARMGRQTQLATACERIGLIDGAPWIRNQIELHGLVENLGLDFYHLQEQSQQARQVLFPNENDDGKHWIGDLMHTFKHDGYDCAWQQLTACRAARRSPRQRQAIDRLMQYIAERQDMIRYPQFLAKDWQIGSGPTEAECKTTTLRVKGRGRRWDSQNAEAMMALAAMHDSGLWNKHWTTLNSQTN